MISIITPVYNAEPYLEQCLESVLRQDYTDWEWILVNDGSTDGSLGILRAYAGRDNRIRVFTQENQGPAAARNRALEHVKGEYVTSLDSDDWIEEGTLRKIREAVDRYAPDMVLWDFRRFRGGKLITGKHPMPPAGYRDSRETREFAADFVFRYTSKNTQIFPSFSIRAIKTQILRDHGLRFDESLKRTEDYLFLAEAHSYLKDMVVIPEPLSVYRANTASITHSYTEGYMEMVDTIYDRILTLDIGTGRDDLVRRADGMYLYRAFVAVDQEIASDKSFGGKIRGIRKILSKERVRTCAAAYKDQGKALFGKEFLFLRIRSAVLLYAILARRNG